MFSEELTAKIMSLYRHQSESNPVLNRYLQAIGRLNSKLTSVDEISFLPIDLYKQHVIKTGDWETEVVFKSSGTTSQTIRSHKHVRSVTAYLEHAQQIFESVYGPANAYVILALLPGYAGDSSLITMVDHLIRLSSFAASQFISGPDQFYELKTVLDQCAEKNIPVILFGVTFSLLEFADWNQSSYPDITIIETGGMKGRKEEWTRAQVHDLLSTSIGTPHIHSEYGMTELMSQAYAVRKGRFDKNDHFLVLPGDLYDPLSSGRLGQNCRLNIIDLGNVDTCSFIATNDVGRVYEDGMFDILGRMDYAELRGCNLLVSG